MKRDALKAARLLVIPTIALLATAVFAPGRLELGARIYALILCTAAIVVLLSAMRRSYPDEGPLREPGRRAFRAIPPSSLERIELEVALAASGTFDLHYRLVPRLRTIATGLLASRRRVSLDASPDIARAILGEEAWELVRQNRPAPEDRLEGGITPRQLGQVVDALEAV